jgi:DNA-binding CsgD family transcriptional regulator/tetratricopeptide (TPR) repeat protein
MASLPGALGVAATFPFVGRSAELERLRTLMPRAAGETSRVVLLAGEAGSGKSRLVREFAAEAADDGVLVLYGACDAVVRSPYGPFVEALDQLVRATEPDELREALGPTGGELTRLLPDLAARVGRLPPALDADPDTERHRLHTAVAALLAGVTRARPALLVLEDGHWADVPTLMLLRHLARAPGARMLLVATFRDTEADVPAVLADVLADLRRYDVVRLRLTGLTDGDVADFVRAASGGDLGPQARRLAGAIHRLTEGNAFLVCELWRTLIETGAVELGPGPLRVLRPPDELGTPNSLPEDTAHLLALAAIAGSEFDVDVVRRAAGLEDAALVSALDEAMRSGMLEEVPSRGLACRFSHELVRRAVYDRLSGPRRAELHLRVGEALEATGDRSRRALVDLARHFAAAAPFGPPERAVAYNVLASRSASAALAFDEAAAWLRTAIDLAPEGTAEVPEWWIECGWATHRAGKVLDALDAFRTAMDIARATGDAELLARAAVGYEDAAWRPGMVDQGVVEIMQEATAALGDEDGELRVGLLSGLARALDLQGHHLHGAVVRENAIAMARRLDDRHGLATILMRAYWSLGASTLEEILDMLTEARALAEELGDTEVLAESVAWQVPTLIAMCELARARATTEALGELAERTGQPFMLHVAEHYAAAIALCDGRLELAEAAAGRSADWGRLLTGRDASAVYGIQMFGIRRERGMLAQLAPVVRVLAGGVRDGPWRPGLVALLAELGMEQEARRELALLLDDGLEPFRSSLWSASLAYLTDASSALGDTAVAALVYPELAPLGGGNVTVGHGVACYGAADRYLGMLASTLEDDEAAVAHFEAALELDRRQGADTWLAHTTFEYGRHLRARDRDARRAGALLDEAAALAQRIGMPGLLARVRAVAGGVAPQPPAPRLRTVHPAPAPVPLPDDLSPREVQILRLVAEGCSNRQIGEALSISEHTAANHVRSILRKTGSANRTEAASYAHRHGLAAH